MKLKCLTRQPNNHKNSFINDKRLSTLEDKRIFESIKYEKVNKMSP